MTEDRTKQTLNIYKGADKVGSGTSPVHIKLDDGEYPAGTFTGAFADANGKESEKVDFPAVTITAQADAAKAQAEKDKTDGTAAGKADGDAGKDAADNSSKSKDYQDAYTAAYTPAKAAYDAAKAKPATGIVASQKTWTAKTGDKKTFTITTDPADADDASAVIAATTAASADETLATVTKTADGTFEVTTVKAGTVNITLTSGSFTVTIAVTITDPEPASDAA